MITIRKQAREQLGLQDSQFTKMIEWHWSDKSWSIRKTWRFLASAPPRGSFLLQRWAHPKLNRVSEGVYNPDTGRLEILAAKSSGNWATENHNLILFREADFDSQEMVKWIEGFTPTLLENVQEVRSYQYLLLEENVDMKLVNTIVIKKADILLSPEQRRLEERLI